MVNKILLFPNTAVICFDEQGEQVAEWQTNLFCEHLRKMCEAGVVDDKTSIVAAAKELKTVKDWLDDASM